MAGKAKVSSKRLRCENKECMLILVALVITVFIVACFPMRNEYFQPSAEGGRITKATCHGTVGPPNTIEFDKEKIHFQISTSAFEHIERGTSLTMMLKIPPHVVATFKSYDLTFFNTNGQTGIGPNRLQQLQYRPSNNPRVALGVDKQLLPITSGQPLPGDELMYYDLAYSLKATALAEAVVTEREAGV